MLLLQLAAQRKLIDSVQQFLVSMLDGLRVFKEVLSLLNIQF